MIAYDCCTIGECAYDNTRRYDRWLDKIFSRTLPVPASTPQRRLGNGNIRTLLPYLRRHLRVVP